PPPGPVPPAPLPVPVPAPPAPVPGPTTFDAPWVGALPWRGISAAAIGLTGGVSTFGLGATTGVASLLMFLGLDPPSFSFGFAVCWAGGGGGGGGGSGARSITWSRANSNPAWIASTAAIAPLLSRPVRSVRYMPHP